MLCGYSFIETRPQSSLYLEAWMSEHARSAPFPRRYFPSSTSSWKCLSTATLGPRIKNKAQLKTS